MANTTIVQITNITKQTIGIIISSIDPEKSNPSSGIEPHKDGPHQVASGSSLIIELQRISVDQLDNLRNLGQITYA